jgi:uncharacterized membrane protein
MFAIHGAWTFKRKKPDMLRFFSRPIPLVLLLVFATGLQVILAAFKVVEVPTGTLPKDGLRLGAAPVSIWLHALGGLLFSLLGPLQFVRALRDRFGALHRLSGRIFLVSGLAMAMSSLSLLWQLDSLSTQFLVVARAIFSVALIVSLIVAVRAARAGKIPEHRAWMIRSYAIGVGGTSVAVVMFPLYLAGFQVTGLMVDLIFVGWWLITIGLSQLVINYIQRRETSRQKPQT